ncbi:transposase [Streptomyces verrucosisporus]|uniref:transposase n=1 Tax=Streptomyces verrucosisporus TaxID=1695161 RepID=UPI0027DA2721|nr:transposase [Streptomyces verrucosisporus]
MPVLTIDRTVTRDTAGRFTTGHNAWEPVEKPSVYRTETTATTGPLLPPDEDQDLFGVDRALKAYAGSDPITRSSGRKITVLAKHIKNRRLASADYTWALTALTAYGDRPKQPQEEREPSGPR